MSTQPITTLPVVVHVIHTGGPVGSMNNPSDAAIQAMITLMNDAFQKNGPFYGGANVEFGYELANQSPDCEKTTGINRIDGSGVPNYTLGGITTDTETYPNSAHELIIKGLSRWPNTDYINIWLVNMIDGNPFGLAGYAYFPEYNNALTDGIVMRANAISDGNKTIIHELGHYFNLHHTFGNAWTMCISEPDCASGGDFICDTENCRYTTDCNSSINPCSGAPWLIADAENNYTVLHNYMGYTNCQWMFTEEQKDVMHFALNNFRPGLLSSGALGTSSSGIPALACIPGAANGLSPFYGIQRVEFASLNVYSNSSEADGAFYIDRTCNQQIEIPYGESIFVRITGSFENPQHIRVYLDYDNDGVFETPDELILSGYAGVVQNTITLPVNGPLSCTPLRLRVVTDHPSAPPPTACSLTGTAAQGVGQVEDYTVIIGAREIESVASGNWDNPAVWSCNCIPSEFDVVILNPGHTIQITPAMGILECGELRLDPTAFLDIDGELRVAGGCN